MDDNRVSPAVKNDPKAIEMSIKNHYSQLKTVACFVVFLARVKSAVHFE